MSWDEDGDKPCDMEIDPRALSGPASSGSSPASMDICGNPEPSLAGTTSQRKTVSFGGNPRHYLRGVAVCTNNNDNHRLKGIRIYAAKVWLAPEQVDELSASDQADRPNCATWHPAVYCPADQIASALVVHHSDKEITGLGLRCRKVEW
jgi:hypothetical protein